MNLTLRQLENQMAAVVQERDELKALLSTGVLVDRGALQLVVNALRRDAEEGRLVRGEMADELLKVKN